MNKDKVKNFKLSIRSKIIISYISIVLVMAFFSLIFIAMFYEIYMLSDANDKLQSEANEIAALAMTNYMFDGSVVGSPLSGQLFLRSKLEEFDHALMIISPEGELMYEYKLTLTATESKKFAQQIMYTANKIGPSHINFDGIDYAVYVRAVTKSPDDNNLLCYVVPFYETKAFSVSRPLKTFYILTIIISANFAIIIGGFLSGTLTHNLKKLKLRANLLANRKFDANIPIRSHDEIEELSHSFDVMAQSIKEYDIQQKMFLQNASHEFRTPLTSIRGYIEGLRDGIFDVPKATDMIVDQVGRLEGLVEEVMFLSKIETSDGIYNPSEMTAAELMEETIRRTEGMMHHKNIDLKVSPAPEITFIGDCEKLATVITNLISNSVRFAKTTVTVTSMIEGESLTVTVSDDGPGISPKDMDKLFVRFYKGQKGNHGLGLSIAKAIMTSHNGSISARNKEETDADGIVTQIVGAEFQIKIPLNNTKSSIR